MESVLVDKLAEIESKHAAGKIGEGAIEAIRRQLGERRAREGDIEYRCSVADPSMQRVFVVVCERYGIEPYRVPRQRQSTISIRAPRSFIQEILWPLFEEMARLVEEWLYEKTSELMRAWSTRE
jgi:hypothetical protein